MADSKTKVLFIHHSVGRYILRHGDLRNRFIAKLAKRGTAIDLWDHDYNKIGLTAPEGKLLGRAFPIPNDDTDPPGLVGLLDGVQEPDGYGIEFVSFDIVLMKSCYPNNAIRNAEQIASIKDTYEQLFSRMSSFPEISFVLITSPPLARLRTNAAEAKRAMGVAAWLTSRDTPPNVSVLDLFSVLAEPPESVHAGTLRRSYQRLLPIDSHPNRAGCTAAAEAIAEYVDDHFSRLMRRA